MTREERTFEIAQHVAQLLQGRGVETAIIGAVAMAARNYPRATADLDLATDTDPFTILPEVCRSLREEGFDAEFNEPDRDDSLGGVLTVHGAEFEPVQVVNFYNPYGPGKNPGAEAIATAESGLLPGTTLRVARLAQLIALKMYAGGYKSKLDVAELLERNPDLDVNEVRDTCARYDLRSDFDELLKQVRGA